jgi:hypothetical protein
MGALRVNGIDAGKCAVAGTEFCYAIPWHRSHLVLFAAVHAQILRAPVYILDLPGLA